MVVAAPESELAAVNVTAYLPLSPEAGVQLNVPLVRLAFAENVAPDGSPEATSDAMVWPSGSEAETANVIADTSAPPAVAGAVQTGARSTVRTVVVVGAESVRAVGAR